MACAVAVAVVLVVCLCLGAWGQSVPECLNGTVRLTIGGVPQNSSGQVEVCPFGVWGTVCDDAWDIADATVVCRQLGYNFGEAVLFSFFDIGPPRDILLDEVGCRGSEPSLLDCTNDGIGIHDCSDFEHAGVTCTMGEAECTEGDVRLTIGGLPQNSSGQVEVCPFGMWGAVCDDAWDNMDATVVCRQLGLTFGEAVDQSFFDIGPPRPILLDEVGCLSSEASLLDCTNDGIGNHDCSDTEHAGVTCTMPEPECTNGDHRLTVDGVPQNSSGQVEVCAFGVWGVVCDDSWDLRDATVVCRQLGFNFSVAFGESFFAVGPPREILLDEVGCNGTEASLLNCSNDGIFNHDCNEFEHAGVRCSNTPECTDGDTRLTIVGVPQNSSGQVEVCQLQVWGVVCDDGWDATDASVVCRQYQFNFGEAVRESFFDIGLPRSILLDDVDCNGFENSLLDCQHKGIFNHNCGVDEHAGVRCSNVDVVPGCMNGDVRLTNGGAVQNGSGQVELCNDGEWGVVCDNEWDAIDASVVCRQLGFSFGEATIRSSFDPGPPLAIFLDNVECDGSEINLLVCSNDGIGNHNCEAFQNAGAICYFGPECTDGDTRLTIGGVPQNSSGQVEVCDTVWGVVCDDLWNSRDATVVCGQYGFSFGEAVRKSTFDTGPPRPVFLDSVLCGGFEDSLLNCSSGGLRNHDCNSFEHAGVRCSDAPQCEDDEVSLRDDGTGENDGTVQYCLFGQWETICDEDWTDDAASVVCRQLNRTSDGVTGRFSTEDAARVSFLEFECNGNEASLSQCTALTVSVACSARASIAGVSCLDRQVTGCVENEVRIASDGVYEQFGRVEICRSGVWGVVCDNMWGDDDAAVVCRQLDFTGGVATKGSAFRLQTLRPVFLDRVDCAGTETGLANCPHNDFAQSTCSSGRYSGVACDNGDEIERCGAEFIDSEEFLRLSSIFGSCELFDAPSELCSSVYDASKFVYVQDTTQTALATTLDNTVSTELFEERCKEPIARILCQFFLPPCGANNVTYLPTAICSEECLEVQNECSRDWNIVEDILAAANMERINCFSTEDAITPLPSCCTGAGLQSFSAQSSDATTGGIIGGVLGAVVLVTGVICILVMLIVVMRLKRRKMEVEHLQMAVLTSTRDDAIRQTNYRNMDKQDHSPSLSSSQAVPNPYSRSGGATTEVSPTEDSEVGKKILSRFSAQFARQLSTKLRITKDNLVLQEKVGSGEFGVVYKALLTERGGTGSMTVAVKTLKGLYDHNEIHKILDESLKMKFFNHPNVLSLIGVCLDTGAAPYIIMPYMANGSLQQYLKKERANLILGENVDTDEVEDVQKRLTVMCLHVAQGMEYLATQRFVHRDLAVRNCMIDMHFVIKVADFGLSEDVYAKSYFRQEKDVSIKLPVKWMAPECLNDGLFSEKSDVWSYGVTCWEVFSGGKVPYPGVDPRALSQLLDNGERLSKPNNAACPDHMFGVMQECWEANPDDRPEFSGLVREISSYATNLAGYFDFNDFNPFQRPESGQQQQASASDDLASSKQGSTTSLNSADSEVLVKSKQPATQRIERNARRKKSGMSLSERTKRFIPKLMLRSTNQPTSFDLEEEKAVQRKELDGAGIQINIEPAS